MVLGVKYIYIYLKTGFKVGKKIPFEKMETKTSHNDLMKTLIVMLFQDL